jgi:hypothetical protein
LGIIIYNIWRFFYLFSISEANRQALAGALYAPIEQDESRWSKEQFFTTEGGFWVIL